MPIPSDTPTRHDSHGRYPEAATVEDFQLNLAAVQMRIAAACHRVGRDPATVRLLPVSKTKPESRLRMAHTAGCRVLGENKVQEAYRKWEAMQDLADLQWSVIGHLQTNKAKLVARSLLNFRHWIACDWLKRWIAAYTLKDVRWMYSCRLIPPARPVSTVCLLKTYPLLFRLFPHSLRYVCVGS